MFVIMCSLRSGVDVRTNILAMLKFPSPVPTLTIPCYVFALALLEFEVILPVFVVICYKIL
jgi:hypothetical protein